MSLGCLPPGLGPPPPRSNAQRGVHVMQVRWPPTDPQPPPQAYALGVEVRLRRAAGAPGLAPARARLTLEGPGGGVAVLHEGRHAGTEPEPEEEEEEGAARPRRPGPARFKFADSGAWTVRQRKRALRERGATAAAEIVWRPQQPLWRALNRADASGDAAANVTAKRGRAGPGQGRWALRLEAPAADGAAVAGWTLWHCPSMYSLDRAMRGEAADGPAVAKALAVANAAAGPRRWLPGVVAAEAEALSVFSAAEVAAKLYPGGPSKGMLVLEGHAAENEKSIMSHFGR